MTTPDTATYDDTLPNGLDFDTWDETAETAAIQQIADNSGIKYVVGDGHFWGRFPDGRIIKTPVKITVSVLEKVSELTNAGDEVEQVRQILTLLGDQASADYLNNADLISVTDYATKYFKVFERITKVTMGE